MDVCQKWKKKICRYFCFVMTLNISEECRLCMQSSHLILLLLYVSLQCFMNSILQCLSNTHDLRDYCLRNSHRTDLNNNCRAKAALMEGK